MRHQGLRLLVVALVLLTLLFHAELIAHLGAMAADKADVPDYLKVLAGAGVVALLAIRHLR